MKVVRAAAAGACYGVQRALDLAYEAASKGGDIKTLGPLIHNPQVIEQLREQGIDVIAQAEQATQGTVIIRSHGVGPADKRVLESADIEIVDATCPYVLRAQKAGERLSADIGAVVVVGDPHHPEVDAIRAYAQEAGGKVWAVDSAAAIPQDIPSRVGVVVQTTQNRSVLEEVLDALAEKGVDVQLKDTICSATSERQQAAREVAARVDAMVVIGGHNSSNTTRLYEICSAICPKTYHIETKAELDVDSLRGCETVGITAGASTPEDQIIDVEEYIEGL